MFSPKLILVKCFSNDIPFSNNLSIHQHINAISGSDMQLPFTSCRYVEVQNNTTVSMHLNFMLDGCEC